jgi:hypothetical protein
MHASSPSESTFHPQVFPTLARSRSIDIFNYADADARSVAKIKHLRLTWTGIKYTISFTECLD